MMDGDRRVLDIPAIPYVDVERQQRERAVQRQQVVPPAASVVRRATTKEQRMPRQAVIGPQIVEAVNAKLAEGGLNRSQAFAAVAKDRGMRPGTVAANFYRVVRKQDPGALKPTRRTRTARPATRRAARSAAPQRAARATAPAAAGDVQEIAAQLVKNVEALAAAVLAQSREVKELRSRLDGVRSLLA